MKYETLLIASNGGGKKKLYLSALEEMTFLQNSLKSIDVRVFAGFMDG